MQFMQSRIINFHEQHEFVKVKVNSAELNTKNLQDYLTQCENHYLQIFPKF